MPIWAIELFVLAIFVAFVFVVLPVSVVAAVSKKNKQKEGRR